jgi:type III pantothenate kinase
VIGPGLEISIEALAARAAKLPRIDIAEPQAAIGTSTQTALQSGFVYGFAGLVDGICRRLLAELDPGATVIATGGLATSVAPLCETVDEIDPLLTLKGLLLVEERNR